ncbi:MAG: hypothetical protein LBF37_04000 [Rickettsiales bacterium]|jgi:hypothetical protein|nr:hypothetical protein [Rickettsiales bacterium]
MAEKKNRKGAFRKVWGILGLAALFACGVAVGLFYNTTLIKTTSCVPDSQCSDLANQIANTGFDLQKQEELIILYNQNCFYNNPLKKAEPVKIGPEKKVPELKKRPQPKPKMVEDPLRAMEAERTCDVVETLLLKQLKYYSAKNSPDPKEHFGRAQIYAKLSNLGCVENYSKYRSLAMREIAIAHALNSNKFQGDKETIDNIKEYKKQKKGTEAQATFEMVKELTDPAIDFILELDEVMCQ